MKRYFLSLYILFLGVVAYGQAYVYNFPNDTTATGTEFIPFQTHPGAAYINWKMPFPYAKRYFSPNVVTSPIAFVPDTASTGQKYNYLGKFVTDPNDVVWYVDGQGLVQQISTPPQAAPDAGDIPLATPISFGGVEADTVQEALEVIDARLDTAINQGVNSVSYNATTDILTLTRPGGNLTASIPTDTIFFPNGRTWYIAKTGSNSGCKVGNPEKPCLTLDAVRDSVITGDNIFVFPGNYITGSATNISPATADSITWYYSAGTNISGYRIGLPSGSGDRFFRVLGHARFVTNGGAFQARPFTFSSSTRKINLIFECDEIVCDGFIEHLAKFDMVDIRVKNLTITAASNAYGFALGINSANGDDGTTIGLANINIGNVNMSATGTGFRGDGAIKLYSLKNKKVNIDIGSYENLTAQTTLGSIVSSRGFGLDSCQVNIKVASVNIRSKVSSYTIDETTRAGIGNTAEAGAANLFGSLFSGGAPTGTNRKTHLNISLGSVYSEEPVYSPWNGLETNISIGEFRTNKNNPVFLTDSESTNSSSITNLKCDYCTGSGAMILENGRRGLNDYSGKFVTTGTSIPVIRYDAENLSIVSFLRNATLIAPSSTAVIAPITASNAKSYLIQNVATNSTTTNADVTEVVQPITRNSNVR